MLVFIAGLMVGGALGVIMMCLVTAAGEADRHMEECEYEVMAKNDQTPEASSTRQGGCRQ